MFLVCFHRKKDKDKFVSVTDWMMYIQVYIMAVAIVTDRLTPGLLMTYSMTMMEVWAQLNRRKGIAYTKCFMVSRVRIFRSVSLFYFVVCAGI